jgi:hypothetical protein
MNARTLSLLIRLAAVAVIMAIASRLAARTLTVLHSFGADDGSEPHAAVVIGAGGVLYGTTTYSGIYTGCESSCGTVFSLTPPGIAGGSWTETVLHYFTGLDGSYPYGPILIGPGGVLFDRAYPRRRGTISPTDGTRQLCVRQG